jgi:hypothetical protein
LESAEDGAGRRVAEARELVDGVVGEAVARRS